jgi:hypothetical protein
MERTRTYEHFRQTLRNLADSTPRLFRPSQAVLDTLALEIAEGVRIAIAEDRAARKEGKAA